MFLFLMSKKLVFLLSTQGLRDAKTKEEEERAIEELAKRAFKAFQSYSPNESRREDRQDGK